MSVMAESLKQFLGKEAVPIFGWTQDVPVADKAVQHGRTTVGKHYDPSKDRGLWYNTPEINQIRFKALEGGLKAILEKQNDKLLNRAAAGAEKQLGTLGTGNHFIEVCLGGCPRM